MEFQERETGPKVLPNSPMSIKLLRELQQLDIEKKVFLNPIEREDYRQAEFYNLILQYETKEGGVQKTLHNRRNKPKDMRLNTAVKLIKKEMPDIKIIQLFMNPIKQEGL